MAADMTTLANGAINALEKLRDDVRTIAGPLSEQEFWAKPVDPGNSVGHLVLHLTGNLNHFVGATGAQRLRARSRARIHRDAAAGENRGVAATRRGGGDFSPRRIGPQRGAAGRTASGAAPGCGDECFDAFGGAFRPTSRANVVHCSAGQVLVERHRQNGRCREPSGTSAPSGSARRTYHFGVVALLRHGRSTRSRIKHFVTFQQHQATRQITLEEAAERHRGHTEAGGHETQVLHEMTRLQKQKTQACARRICSARAPRRRPATRGRPRRPHVPETATTSGVLRDPHEAIIATNDVRIDRNDRVHSAAIPVTERRDTVPELAIRRPRARGRDRSGR